MEILFVPRSTVSRIVASTDIDRIATGVSEGTFKDRYINPITVVYFISIMSIAVASIILWIVSDILILPILLAIIGFGLGLALLSLTIMDLSIIRGITLIVAGVVTSFINAFMGLLIANFQFKI
jgi:hypothetical protein